MRSTHCIVVSIDADESSRLALTRAAQLAKALNAPLTLLSCTYDTYLAGVRFSDSESLRNMRQDLLRNEIEALETLAEEYRQDGLEISTRAVWDTPAHDAIVRQLVALDAQLLVTAARHHTVLERSFFGNTDWQLLRVAPCPVLVVKRRQYAAEPRIWAAVDPMHEHDKPAELDDQLILWGQKLADRLHGELHLVHAVEDAAMLASLAASATMPIALPVEEMQATLDESHSKRLTELQAEYELDEEQMHQHKGTPARVLADVVKANDVDVLILGVVSRSMIKRAIIGHTAERLLERLPCDLLVVKPRWFDTPVAMHTDMEMVTG